MDIAIYRMIDCNFSSPEKTDRIRGAIRRRNVTRGVNVDKRKGRFKQASLKSRLTLCKSFLSVFVVNFLTCVTRNERKGESRGWRRKGRWSLSFHLITRAKKGTGFFFPFLFFIFFIFFFLFSLNISSDMVHLTPWPGWHVCNWSACKVENGWNVWTSTPKLEELAFLTLPILLFIYMYLLLFCFLCFLFFSLFDIIEKFFNVEY